MPLELVVGVGVTGILAAVTIFAWSPPEEVTRRLLKRQLRHGVRDANEAYRTTERLLQRIGMATGMALFVSAFLTGWLAIQASTLGH